MHLSEWLVLSTANNSSRPSAPAATARPSATVPPRLAHGDHSPLATCCQRCSTVPFAFVLNSSSRPSTFCPTARLPPHSAATGPAEANDGHSTAAAKTAAAVFASRPAARAMPLGIGLIKTQSPLVDRTFASFRRFPDEAKHIGPFAGVI